MRRRDSSGKMLYNAVLLSAVTVGLRAVAVSFNAYVAKTIGAAALGLFTLVMSVHGLALTFAVSGIHLAAVRMTAERLARCEAAGMQGKDLRRALRRECAGCLSYSLFFGMFAGILLFTLSGVIGTYVLGDVRTIPALRILALGLPPVALTTALSGYFTGLRKVYKNALLSLCEQGVQILVICAGIALLVPRGVEYACIALVLGATAAQLASLLFAILLFLTDQGAAGTGEMTLSAPPPEEGSSLSRAASLALPMAVGSYMRQGLHCAEHIAIPAGLRRSGADPEAALASYGILHGMVFQLIFFPSAVIGAVSSLLVPELAGCAAVGDAARARSIGSRVMQLSLRFSIAVAGVFLAFAHPLGSGIYGSAEAGRYIAAFAPLVPLMYLDTTVDAVLKGLGQQVYCMKVNILDAAMSLGLVCTLLPRFGIWGYVCSVYVTETVNAALSIHRMLAVTGVRFRLRWIALPGCAVLLSATGVRAAAGLYPLPLPVWLQIGATAALYAGLLAVFLRISRKESPARTCTLHRTMVKY